MWRKTGLTEGGEDAEFASRCGDSRSFRVSGCSARSIDGRNSDQVADSRRSIPYIFQLVSTHRTLARIAPAGRIGDSKERDERRWQSRVKEEP